MYKREDTDFLKDIKDRCERITQNLQNKTFEDFLQDKNLQDIIVHNLEIIGEATKWLSDNFKKSHSDIPWKNLSAMRDKLIHRYFGIDHKIVWDIAIKDIPQLLNQIKDIFKE